MHHGSGPQTPQRHVQRPRSFTGSEGEEQPAHSDPPPSPATPFAPSASPSAPQSPGYQIQQLMSRSPVAGQNVNITLQSVGPVVAGNQQITLAPLPLPSPTSPGFQFSAQPRRFEHGSPSYIQVTSPLSQQVQTQSPTQPSPGPGQALPSVRAGAPGPGLGICSSSPTGGFVDASVLVRQISLSPSSGGHFVFQEGSGLTQIAQGAQVQLQHAGTPMAARERRLSQPHAQPGGTIHHLGPQSPAAAGGAGLQPLPGSGHIATASLPPQISSIIQGQLIQQQQVLQGQPLARPLGFDRTPGVLLPGVGGTSGFGMTSPPPPTSPSRTAMPPGLSSLPPSSSGSAGVRKAPRKLEEIPPASQEMAQMRKQCLDYHYREMEALKEVFKEYLIELFFLQHLQGNMMDFLAFKKKLYGPLQAYLRQNDLDLEEEEEEQSEVINDEVKVVAGKDGQTGTPVAIATQLPPEVSAAFSSQQQPFQQMHTGTPGPGNVNSMEIEALKRQQTLTPTDSPKRPRLEVGRPGTGFQHPGVASGVPLQQLMPTAQGGMPPAPQAAQLTGHRQSQQQYDPSTGPPVQNAASLHTPPPQLPRRLPPAGVPTASLQTSQQLVTEPQAQSPGQGRTQQPMAPLPPLLPGRLSVPSQQAAQPALHLPAQGQAAPLACQPQPAVLSQTLLLVRPSGDPAPASAPASASAAPAPSPPPSAPAGTAPLSVCALQTSSSPPASHKAPSPDASRAAVPRAQDTAPASAAQPQESSQDRIAEQIKQENQVHQRVAELRKAGLWSARRLPKLQEAPRPRSHWDCLLEEAQWMATDFAQERRWKVAAAKKMVRTVARHHEDRRRSAAKARTEQQSKLRRIAASIAREVECFWSNIEQVVEIKLQIEFQEKQKKALNLNKYSKRGRDSRAWEASARLGSKSDMDSPSGKKRKVSTSLTDEEVEDEEETIEEQETKEGNINHQAELSHLVREADLPLDDLLKLYEGAFVENSRWPPPVLGSEGSASEEDVEQTPKDRGKAEVVVIDSLLSMDQCRDGERMSVARKHARDISEVAAAAEVLLPKGSARVTTAVKYNTPSLLYGALREYQKIGLDWLAKLYKRKLNGILADDAGLGKTVQVIALFAHLACNEGNWGPHLIVARSRNTLKWELELKRWCPGLKVLLYLGRPRGRRAKRQGWMEPNSFHICVTSYKQFFRDHHALARVRWKYLVVDEMQQIKNMTEKHWEVLFLLRSQHRLLLIDSPLHNTLPELWTMVHFLIPGISRPYLDFPVKTANEENQDYCHKLVIRLHRMIQPFILRRSKRDVEKQLTKKYEHVLKCRLSNRQKALYDDVILQPRTQEALKSGQFVSVLHVLMKLQRICNHPDLINPRLSGSSYVSEALEFRTASRILQALEPGVWKDTDMSIFDLIGVENKMTHYEAQVLPRQKVTRKLIEEIYNSPPPQSRPHPVKIKPSRLFQPVPYGQKPEGKMVVFPSVQASRPVTAATVAQAGQTRGRPPATTVSANQGGEAVKAAPLAAVAGPQSRVAQPEAPVTLQFQGSKFTLSHSQLRQLTAGQPLQLQGSVLQIVSAPSQQHLRPPGPAAPQSVLQPVPLHRAFGNPPAHTPSPDTVTPPAGAPNRLAVVHLSPGEPGVPPRPAGSLAQESLEERRRLLKERLDRIFSGNERRCSRAPVYGKDLLGICSFFGERKVPPHHFSGDKWAWTGSWSRCPCWEASEPSGDPPEYLALASHPRSNSLQDAVKRVLCVLPAVVAAPPSLYASNPPPSYSHKMKVFRHNLKEELAPYLQQLQQISAPHLLRFPDLRLVQYDSGKLEALAVLLQKLKSEGRRVLILSQMILMLDILELFLNFHFLTFIRIDEYANYEQRQELMRSFNRDKRIFCAILSTHSRSVGVSLVEADTVVFYDSDLNPVVDAQAQEWCDRIGRRKDVHVYRLVSGNSVEEKLLNSGTKDLIREVAAQGSDYTMAFLTQQTIQELFEVHSPTDDSGSRVRAEDFVVLSQEPPAGGAIAPKVAKPFIEALNSIKQEDEEEPASPAEEALGVEPGALGPPTEPSQLDELFAVVDQLTPIEKYALNYLELFHISGNESGPRLTEEHVRGVRVVWELQDVREVEGGPESALLEEEEELLTYTREDAYDREYVCEGADGQTEVMPLWSPPTPPQDDGDIYIDSVMRLMYEASPIPEAKLPPVFVRRGRKRHRADPSAAGRKKKQRHGEGVVPPRSLFDRAHPGMLKVRREGREQKRNLLPKQPAPSARPLPTSAKATGEAAPDSPEWLIGEDWALLQAVKQLLELPLNLAVVSPAHTPNWDLVSDVVNARSRTYRSPRQCRSRYESVIIPREEGKTKSSRPLRTHQIYAQDEGATQTQLYTGHFEGVAVITGRRSPLIKPLLGMNPFQKNPKHASVLAESGISYDKPLHPIQVASLRAERVAKEKKALAEQQRAQPQPVVPQPVVPQPGLPQLGVPQPQQPQPPQHQQATVQPQPGQAGPQIQTQGGQQPSGVGQPAATTASSTAVLAGAVKAAGTGAGTQTVTAAAAAQPPSKTLSAAHLQLLRRQQQQVAQTPAPHGQAQTPAPSPGPIKAVGKLSQEQLIRLQKQKLQQPPPPQAPPGPPQPTAQAQVQPPQPQSPQLTTVAAPRPGALLSGTTVANLQVTRLTRVSASQLQGQGQMSVPASPTAQLGLAKPPVVSVPAAVVSSAGVTALPVNMTGISVAIGQTQKTAGQTVVAQPLHVQQLLKLKQQQQKAAQLPAPGPAAQQKINAQQAAIHTQQPTSQQPKATYTPQPSIKTPFLTSPVSQAPKAPVTQQVQGQMQVAKTPPMAQKQTPVANLQQVAAAAQQVQAQPQATCQPTAGQQQVPVLPAAAPVAPHKLLQQQVVTTVSAQMQASGAPNPGPVPASGEAQSQQPRAQTQAPP
ncbi:E1A-binding protein p400-like [Eulemur rufifrons]|uniref:E1A-binding protein p400-like n=1 Tax=Eulemur rufifrons TaxID=859984 RepID=UPI0037421FE4